jgi:aspartyl-tRNA(Asn)/glutamyl-tRNA(Gln) amidotransferase subunit A
VASHDALSDLRRGVRGLRIAFGETVFFDDVDPQVARAVRETGPVFRALGAHVDSVAVPEAAQAMDDQRRALMVAAEALAVNGRLLEEHAAALDPIVATRMALGRGLSATDYFTVLRRWSALRRSIAQTLRDIDALLVPTTMIPARPVSVIDATPESYVDHNGRYLRNTSLGNVLDLCAVSLPCGVSAEGLPIGLMIYAKPFDEGTALRVAWAYEQATDWRRRTPDLGWAR